MRPLLLLALPVGVLALTACPVLGARINDGASTSTQDEADAQAEDTGEDSDTSEHEDGVDCLDGGTDESGDTGATDPATCPVDACGPALGMPNTLCPDGVTVAGPTGVCLALEDGTCGWEVLSCP